MDIPPPTPPAFPRCLNLIPSQNTYFNESEFKRGGEKWFAPASYRVSWQPPARILVPSDSPTYKLEDFLVLSRNISSQWSWVSWFSCWDWLTPVEQGPRGGNPQTRLGVIAMSLALKKNASASQVVLVVKSPPANAGDLRDVGSFPGLGRSPGGGHGNPLLYSCLENSMGRGTWWASVHRVVKSWARRRRLSMRYYCCLVPLASLRNWNYCYVWMEAVLAPEVFGGEMKIRWIAQFSQISTLSNLSGSYAYFLG